MRTVTVPPFGIDSVRNPSRRVCLPIFAVTATDPAQPSVFCTGQDSRNRNRRLCRRCTRGDTRRIRRKPGPGWPPPGDAALTWTVLVVVALRPSGAVTVSVSVFAPAPRAVYVTVRVAAWLPSGSVHENRSGALPNAFDWLPSTAGDCPPGSAPGPTRRAPGRSGSRHAARP